MTSRTGSARRILVFLKKVESSPASEDWSWLSLARGGLATGSHEMGSRWKSQNRKNVYLSPYVETFNSKVIKGFVPVLRSRYVFFVFRDSYVLCIYVMNILMYVSHIAISGYDIYITCLLFRFGFVFLFISISTLVCYLMLKPSFN